ncbi:hypothetical protein [Methanosarcina mazei]|uniref:hypothetical protein n=1 Tax=Methanosarcina mazei TaxID=2209 RepID=UPI0006979256|nr:hypothetical protein [Methanosarcina mazei]
MHSVEPCCPEVPPEEAEEENTAVWEGSPIRTVGYSIIFRARAKSPVSLSIHISTLASTKRGRTSRKYQCILE